MSFKDYILSRRYQFGRATKASWEFVAFALGREDVLDSTNWAQLEAMLRAEQLPEHLMDGARSTWRSFRHSDWRLRTERAQAVVNPRPANHVATQPAR